MNLEGKKQELSEILDIEGKRRRAKEIEKLMSQSSFWQDHQNAAKVSGEFKYLNELLEKFDSANDENDLEELYLEVQHQGPYDESGAFLSVHAGSGGTEAQDWAQMLLRMYLRYCEKNGYHAQVLDQSPGEEAGIKSATVKIESVRAYGKLKGENGVHRLVRISPFDADKARHTSFALVEIIPIIEKPVVEIKNDDLKIDVYRAGGHGGQSVNTTDSAVRVTHLPTGIVVTCQNERSQLQNKTQALLELQSKLQILEDQKQQKQTRELKGGVINASWGNQIRSYVLHPYQMVKDLRTGYETANTQGVLDGELDAFIESYAKHAMNEGRKETSK